MELRARLLHQARKLGKVPEDIEDPVLHSAAIRSKKPPKGVCVAKDQSAAAKPWISKQSVSQCSPAGNVWLWALSFSFMS